jgi:hypothetical protein
VARVRVRVPVEPKVDTTPQASPSTLASQPQDTPAAPANQWPLKKLAVLGLAVLLVFFVVSLLNDRNNLKRQLKQNNTSQINGQEEASKLAREIGQYVDVPGDEEPKLLTVTESAKTIQQYPALSDIKDGDKILLYTKSRRMIVYRPDTKKVITAVTLAVSDQSQSQGQPPTTAPKPTP